MFESVEQANSYFYNIAFFNRHLFELVVMAHTYVNTIGSFFS